MRYDLKESAEIWAEKQYIYSLSMIKKDIQNEELASIYLKSVANAYYNQTISDNDKDLERLFNKLDMNTVIYHYMIEDYESLEKEYNEYLENQQELYY